jgi:hypothetical protein
MRHCKKYSQLSFIILVTINPDQKYYNLICNFFCCTADVIFFFVPLQTSVGTNNLKFCRIVYTNLAQCQTNRSWYTLVIFSNHTACLHNVVICFFLGIFLLLHVSHLSKQVIFRSFVKFIIISIFNRN